MSLTEILEEVAKLSPAEKRKIIASLSREGVASDGPNEAKQEQLFQNMLRTGLITKIPSKGTKRRVSRPVSIDGKPLSETIIEERR